MAQFGDSTDTYLAEIIDSKNQKRLYESIPRIEAWKGQEASLDFGFKRLATLYALAEAKVSLDDLISVLDGKAVDFKDDIKRLRLRILIASFFSSAKRSLDLVIDEVNLLICGNELGPKDKGIRRKAAAFSEATIKKIKGVAKKTNPQIWHVIGNDVDRMMAVADRVLSVFKEIKGYRDLIVHRGIPWFGVENGAYYLFKAELVDNDKERIYKNHIMKSQPGFAPDIRNSDFPPNRPEITDHLTTLFERIKAFVDEIWGIEADILNKV